MERRPDRLPLGIAIMLMSSVLTCTGQLCWKLASSKESVLFLVGGFALYGFGALLMLVAMRFGELSILHPMLSAGYILSVILGAVVLSEPVAPNKLVGIGVIIVGLILISSSKKEEKP